MLVAHIPCYNGPCAAISYPKIHVGLRAYTLNIGALRRTVVLNGRQIDKNSMPGTTSDFKSKRDVANTVIYLETLDAIIASGLEKVNEGEG